MNRSPQRAKVYDFYLFGRFAKGLERIEARSTNC